jgi:hypothetical protein
MNIHTKKPFLTDAEKRAQDWVLRAKSPKVPSPMSWQGFNRSTVKKPDKGDKGVEIKGSIKGVSTL